MGLHEQNHGDSRIHTATYNAMVRLCRRLGRMGFSPLDFSIQRDIVSINHKVTLVAAVVVGGGKRWDKSAWTGKKSYFLKIPYDGVTAPSYATSMPEMIAMPADDGTDDRAEALYIDLSETPGPVFHVGRA